MLAFLPVLAQLVITASAPDTAVVGQPFLLTVDVRAASVVMPRVVVPDFSPLAVTGSRTSSRQRPSASVQLEYQFEAARPGRYTIPPFLAYVGADTARSRPRVVTVVGTGRRPPPAIIGSARIDTSVTVSVSAAADPDTVYVGQQATYQVGMFIDEALGQQLTRAPTLSPPEMRAVMTYDLPAVSELVAPRVVGSHRFDAHVFQRALFPLSPGTYVIPPAQLEYALPTSYGFFSRPEAFVLRTDSVALVVRDLPLAGRPADFRGAVGQLQVESRLERSALRVGDPTRLIVRVTGAGNLKLLPRPEVTLAWGLLVPTTERVEVDTTSAVVRGTKEFEWVFTPRAAGAQTFPAIRYPFFNPGAARYDVALSVPETLTVEAGALVADEVARATPALAIRTAFHGSRSTDFPIAPVSWALVALAPIPALFLTLVRRPRRRRQPAPAERLRGLADTASDAVSVRRAYVAALASRLGVPASAVAARPECIRMLRRAGVTAKTATTVQHLLAELDHAAYGAAGSAAPDLGRRAGEAYAAVAEEARPLPSSTGAPALRSLTVGLSLLVLAASPAGDQFDRGVSLYRAREFADAQQAFRESARLDPGAPDAWANFGTASWMVGDTADAVVGWQRAVRLDPVAADLRADLAKVSASGWGSLGWVAPIPVLPITVVAGVCWLAAWTLVALGGVTGRKRWEWVSGALGAALILGGGSAVLRHQMAAQDLVVIGGGTSLRSLPALGAESVVRVSPGEIARVVQTASDWSLVEVDGGGRGWVAANALISLARD